VVRKVNLSLHGRDTGILDEHHYDAAGLIPASVTASLLTSSEIDMKACRPGLPARQRRPDPERPDPGPREHPVA